MQKCHWLSQQLLMWQYCEGTQRVKVFKFRHVFVGVYTAMIVLGTSRRRNEKLLWQIDSGDTDQNHITSKEGVPLMKSSISASSSGQTHKFPYFY